MQNKKNFLFNIKTNLIWYEHYTQTAVSKSVMHWWVEDSVSCARWFEKR